MRGGSFVPAVIILTFAATGTGAQSTPSDHPAKPAAADPAVKPADPASGATPPPAAANARSEFPAKKAKKMYATNDYRGRKAPELKVEKWLTPPAKPAAPDTKGKVVLVDYWATWCPPCRRLIPELNHWQKEFKDDLVIIGISDEPSPKVEDYMKATPVEYAMALDTRRNEMTKNTIGVAGIPHVMVIDSTGICRWQGFPQSEEEVLTTEVLKQIIAADKAQRGEKKAEAAPLAETTDHPHKPDEPRTK